MNKILIGVNALLVIAVAFLFYKLNSIGKSGAEEQTAGKSDSSLTAKKPEPKNIATPPTGKIAYINIDVINEKSDEVEDLVAELKRSRSNLEGSFETISNSYQAKMEEYQRMAKSGIAPQSQLDELAKEIQKIQAQAENKQVQMDNLTVTMNEKNHDFQQGLKDFLVRWNEGRYDYILTYSDNIPTMLLGNASLDITAEVIEKVNAEYNAKKTQPKIKK